MTSTGTPIDPAAFEKLRRIAPNLLAARREGDDAADWHARPLPEEIAFKLTNRCDLRCAHCYQWSDDGYHHHLAPDERRGDLDLALVARTLEATRPVRSNVFLWGGEPLVYRDWDGLVELLVNDPRWTSVCTNGTLIERRLLSLCRLGRHLEVSVSLDGFEAEHDALRGAGAFARTWRGLRLLLDQQRVQAFAGQATVNCVISDPMVPRLHEFVAFLDGEGIDTVYVSLPWYLAAAGAARMDDYFARYYGWAPGPDSPSWHSYTFRLNPAGIDALAAEIARIDAADWRIKVRFNPRIDGDDLRPFILGSDKPAQHKTRCQSIRTRMDVFPNGDVVSCKFFPEFRVGNLHEADLAAIWQGQRFNQVRATVFGCGLMPACAKCNLLYTRGT
jgi:radical SAM protein with 4Fe4S-binding SPASM domain